MSRVWDLLMTINDGNTVNCLINNSSQTMSFGVEILYVNILKHFQ